MKLFVVSGYRRTGTSMMMQALDAGLIESHALMFKARSEKFVSPDNSGYSPNPRGLQEVGQLFYMDVENLRTIPATGTALIKIFFDGLLALPAGHDYRIVFMKRGTAAIQASCKRVDKYKKEKEYKSFKRDGEFHMPFDCFAPYNEEDIDHVIQICRQRKDMRIITVKYEDVITDPLAVFQGLNCDWLPLDPKKAAAVIQPALKRY